MKLSSTLNDGIIQTLDRLCGSSVNTYSFKAKISDINDALDWYYSIAFKSGLNWELDDSNETSPPIDTQSLVSGTNRYKFSSFTEKIINLIKLEILDDSGQGLNLIPETMDNLSASFQELYLDTANTGTPTHYIKYGDFIYLRPFPNYSETDGLKAYFNRPASKFEFVSCQPEADDELITAVAHGLLADDTVIFEVDAGGTISAGITADTQYYVISTSLTADVFKVSATIGGSSIDITSDGSGMTFLKTNGEPGITSIHHRMLARKAALTNLSYISSPKLGFLPQQVLLDGKEIESFYANRTKDKDKIFTPVRQNNK